jgi:hypothetical protein
LVAGARVRRRDQAEHERLVRLPQRPNAGGLFLGDYAGLTSSGKALFDMSQPIATTGQSDTFFNSAG